LVRLFFSLGCLLQGCNGEPDVIPLSLEPSSESVVREPVRHIQAGIGASIGIGQFADGRRDRVILGVKSGRWGTWDSCIFAVKGGDLGRATAKVLSRYLNASGWKIRKIDEGNTTFPRIVVTGEIIEMQVNASSNLLSTHVTTSVILLVEEEDRTTGKRLSARLTGSGSKNVFWFDPDDAESLLKDSLIDAFHQWSPGMDGNEQMVGSRPEAD
jgi:hypothetical protein